MDNPLCADLLHNFQKTISMLKNTIKAFNAEQWLRGVSFFEVPAKVAFHTVDCLDYYFLENQEAYKWGYRFGGGWWELKDDELPSQPDLVKYLEEIEAKIIQLLVNMQDHELSQPHDTENTRLGYYIYALRHTIHHQGALNLMAVYHEVGEQEWE